MRILLIFCIFTYTYCFCTGVFAEDILRDKLQGESGAYEISDYSKLPKVWLLEREIVLNDAKALGLYLNAPPGSKVVVEVTALSSLSKRGKNRKKYSKRRIRTLSAVDKATWALEFLNQKGKISKFLQIENDDSSEEQGLAFVFPDSCLKNAKYLVRILVDFQNVNLNNQDYTEFFSQFPVRLEVNFSNPPSSQQTLFKYPSEKNPSEAVVLMRTSGSGNAYLHFTYSKNGIPSDYATLAVDNYFYSGLGLFTRVYMNGSYLNGKKVSMHHISTDLGAIYSVCLTLQRKRQQLEGYN